MPQIVARRVVVGAVAVLLGVGHGDPVLDVGQRPVEGPDEPVHRPAVEVLDHQLDVGGVEEPEEPGLLRPRERHRGAAAVRRRCAGRATGPARRSARRAGTGPGPTAAQGPASSRNGVALASALHSDAPRSFIAWTGEGIGLAGIEAGDHQAPSVGGERRDRLESERVRRAAPDDEASSSSSELSSQVRSTSCVESGWAVSPLGAAGGGGGGEGGGRTASRFAAAQLVARCRVGRREQRERPEQRQLFEPRVGKEAGHVGEAPGVSRRAVGHP